MTNAVSGKILRFHLALVVLGCMLSALVFFIGQSISSTTSALVEVDLPLQENISKLRFAIFSQKPILYEYYADTNKETFLKHFNDSKKVIKEGLYMIPRDDQGQSFLTQLEFQTGQIEQLAGQLDQTLSSSSVDWDKAREILVDVSATEKKITPLIDNFVLLNQKHITDLGALAKNRVQIITGLVAAFFLIILALALILGKSVNNFINHK